MAYIISLANQKGGVGKTTTAVNLGADLATLGKKVLLVDVDAQGNATSGVGISKARIHKDMYDVLVNREPLKNIIMQTSHKRLEIAPATIQLSGADVELTPMIARETRLTEALKPVKADYDFILIDCPPSLGLITINAFSASNSILIPVQSEYYALEGLSQLLNIMKLVREHFNPDLSLEGVLITMFDARTRLGKQVNQQVREYFKNLVYKTVIPRNVRLSEAPSHGVPISDYDPRCKGAKVYMQLAKEVLAAHGK